MKNILIPTEFVTIPTIPSPDHLFAPDHPSSIVLSYVWAKITEASLATPETTQEISAKICFIVIGTLNMIITNRSKSR
ncbi:hypothetical protein M9Y10_024085 [Tritrichomonas musculus]|uniref:Uncharacterized protein n=1 Tax=Tritrichomonas musculus TaxID=1915356 RepID=A0ABR2KWZ4_9EUKA